jgi:hypothetical protein
MRVLDMSIGPLCLLHTGRSRSESEVDQTNDSTGVSLVSERGQSLSKIQ